MEATDIVDSSDNDLDDGEDLEPEPEPQLPDAHKLKSLPDPDVVIDINPLDLEVRDKPVEVNVDQVLQNILVNYNNIKEDRSTTSNTLNHLTDLVSHGMKVEAALPL